MNMDANQLSQRMAENVTAIVEHLLPNGKKASGEWKAGSIDGDAGQSLSVRLTGAKRGTWKDFNAGNGGDLLDLWAQCRALSIGEAMKEVKSFLNIREEMPQKAEATYKRPQKPNCTAPKAPVRDWLLSRGISDETMAAFKIAEQRRGNSTYAVFPYLRDGELVNAKYRNVDEKKDMRQEGGAEPCLFGWHLIDPKARSVVICEGEIDCMTLHQLGIPALSVNAGAGNYQWIENDWDRLQRFSDIFICYDDDDAGQKGAREVVQRLGMERCRVMLLDGFKDPNEALQDGATREHFDHYMRSARALDPDELRSAADFMGEVKSLFYPSRDSIQNPLLKFSGDSFDWFEFRPGEVTIWTGFNGHGKSLLLNQVLIGIMTQGEKTCVFSGEMTPAQQGKRTVKQISGIDRPSPEFIDHIGSWLRDRMWLFNLVGSATIDRLLEVFAYAKRRYGIRHFVIDSLMMTDVPEDGAGAFSAQKDAMRKLRAFVTANGAHIHLVAHPRKAQDESRAPGKLDVSGSSKLTDAADNVFSVWSARKEDGDPDVEKPDALLELHKNRNGDVQHKKLWLYFNRDAMQFSKHVSRRPFQHIPFSTQEAVCQDS